MEITKAHLSAARRDASRLLVLIVALWLLAGVMIQRGTPAVIVMAYGAPFGLAIALLLAANLVRSGISPLPLAAFLPGVVYILAGAFLDITVTIVFTPDLRLEGNPVARALLDSGHSVLFVYGYAFVAQSFYLAFLTLLWASLLRHRWLILGSARKTHAITQLAPDGIGIAYHVFWVIAVILLAAAVDRWYLAAQWLGLVSGLVPWVIGISIVIGLGIYVIWLWCATPHLPIHETATPAPTKESAQQSTGAGLPRE
jgi:hypothetical protein